MFALCEEYVTKVIVSYNKVVNSNLSLEMTHKCIPLLYIINYSKDTKYKYNQKQCPMLSNVCNYETVTWGHGWLSSLRE